MAVYKKILILNEFMLEPQVGIAKNELLNPFLYSKN